MASKYKEDILTISKLEATQLDCLIRAALKATQYSAFEHEGKAFRLLEGTVRMNDQGQYIFTPTETLAKLLETKDASLIYKREESRFMQLIALALKEIR